MNLRHVLTLIIFLTLAGETLATHGQGRGTRTPPRRPGNSSPQTTRRDRAVEPGVDGYWAAQRDIQAAIQQLEAYLREAPDGERAETARRQLVVLRNLGLTASQPEWVRMGERYSRGVPLWRVTSVSLGHDRTRVSVEITCGRDDGGDCYFDPFDRRPLVLIDGAGRFYPMLEAGALPQDVRLTAPGRRGETEQAIISGGRTVSVTADFAPLAEGAASAQIYYRDGNRAEPARFSLAPEGKSQ